MYKCDFAIDLFNKKNDIKKVCYIDIIANSEPTKENNYVSIKKIEWNDKKNNKTYMYHFYSSFYKC